MSSYDERFTAEVIGELTSFKDLIFKNQAEWISHLVQKYGQREDIFVLIRIHPREFPNKREAGVSEHAQKLLTIFDHLPPHFAVNWPKDGFSIYDVLKEVDLVLTAWSGVGREATLLGIPVVSYSAPLLGYPSDLHTVAHSLESYSELVEENLKVSQIDFKKVIKAFRWMTYELEYGAFEIEQWLTLPYYKSRRFGKICEILDRYDFPFFERLDLIQFPWVLNRLGQRFENFLKSGRAVYDSLSDTRSNIPSEREEQEIVRRELVKFYLALFADPEFKNESPLARRLKAYINEPHPQNMKELFSKSSDAEMA
jgi:hypothetical protein